MSPLVFSIFETALVLLLAPAAIGLTRQIKARMQNRRGASVLQPYWALAALCRKEMTVTKHSTWVFRLVPFVVLGSALALAFILPALGPGGWISSRLSSLFLFAGVAAVGSLFLVFGGMDAASAFGGMGASREMTLAALVEPSFVLILATFGLATGAWDLDGVFSVWMIQPWYAVHPLLVLSALALGGVALAENARYPVDNPATHLELTMVHEAMILEYSGPYLAMLEYASAIKYAVFSLLFMHVLFPFGFVSTTTGWISLLGASGLLAVKIAIAATTVGLLESIIVKMRFYRMQEYMATIYFLALAGCILVLAI